MGSALRSPRVRLLQLRPIFPPCTCLHVHTHRPEPSTAAEHKHAECEADAPDPSWAHCTNPCAVQMLVLHVYQHPTPSCMSGKGFNNRNADIYITVHLPLQSVPEWRTDSRLSMPIGPMSHTMQAASSIRQSKQQLGACMPAMYTATQAAAYLVPCSEEGHAGPLLICVQPYRLHQCLLHNTQGLALLVLSHTHVPAIVLAQHDLPGTWELAE